MRCKLLLLLIALVTFNTFGQTTFSFDGDGIWTDEAQWRDGNYPGLTVNLNDTVEILGKLIIPEGISVTNDGTIVSFSSANGNAPDLSVLGNLTNNNSISFSRIQISIVSSGNITMSPGSETVITNSSNLVNSGNITIIGGGLLRLVNSVSSIINEANGHITNLGTIEVINGEFENNAPIERGINNIGTFNITGGEVINRGGFYNDEDAVLNVSKYFTNESTALLTNMGQIAIEGFTSGLGNSGSLINWNTIEVGDFCRFVMSSTSTFINQTTGSVIVAANGYVQNRADLFELQGGKFTNNGTINNETELFIREAAELENNGTLINIGAQITNTGILSGINIEHGSNFANDGILSPGNTNKATGTYNLNGIITKYTQTATGSLNIELGGTVAGDSYDQVIVRRSATLGGALNVTLINGFEPAIGDVFTVLYQGNGITGSFATVNLPTLSSDKEWDAVEYSDADGVRISVKKSTLSISDVNAESLKYKIYPNPASDEIFVSGISMASKAAIFDLNGRRILEVELSRENPSVKLNTLQPGVYLLNVEAKTFKFVKI
ncbi:T9SS type A sorting domain-containing protein [Gelidibacter pelagius]|uniref:T9SS type A sorting domain-containing protein n=1 Tax=Gelidibacter pelagius TaxID=2819985 RepID=A0ABS3SQ04_9FLAO|nr:T9SS type A sorting domain-containing protein [Gelidibacter pelagius]MBO3097788.1 T9SS type A sorting domain-containing protein [Gelidibacter pelagius]